MARMAKASVPRYLRPGTVRQERIVNFPRDQMRPNDTDLPKVSHIMTAAGLYISAESGLHIRKEQR